jgi:hypothetical protein
MFNLSNISTVVTNSLGRTGLVLAKKSPEIMLVGGVGGVVVGTVLACRATLKVSAVIEEAKNNLDLIDSTREQVDDLKYSDADAQRDAALVYVKTGVEIAKLYAPAILIGGISIALIVGSHNVLRKRNAALAAAYKLVDEGFKKYRQRVRDEYGEDIDRKLRFGEKEITTIETTKKGNQKEVTKKVLDNDDVDPYSFVFSEQTATQYKRNYDMNIFALRSAQRYANDMLQIRGHIFLNEVLDMLGIARTPHGAVMGWVKGVNAHNPNNDQYVNFGVDDPVNEEKQNAYDAMVQPFYLNFNVDGNIWDLI